MVYLYNVGGHKVKNTRLQELKKLYGDNVVSTDGLYHIICSDHSEVYINSQNGKLDTRAKYITIAVMQYIIVTKAIMSESNLWVILDKNSLRTRYKTDTLLKYIDENIVYDYGNGTIISHTGRKMCRLDNVKEIIPLGNSKYLIKSVKTYDDKVAYYDREKASLVNMSGDKSCIIERDLKDSSILTIMLMSGVIYTYNLNTRVCKNNFTGKEEKGVILW